MDNRAELLEDDDEEETGNFELRQFYIRNLPSLMRIPLYDISAEVIHIIAVQVHQHEDYPQRWREYISSLGIRKTSALDDIEQTAKVKQQMAMNYALRSPYCHDKSFGQLIKIFLEKQLHILRLIHDDVSNILEKSCTTRVKRLASIEEQSFGTSTKETESAASSSDLNNSYISNNSCTASGISCIQDIHNAGHRSCDFSHLQNSTSNKMKIQGTSGGIKEVHLEVLITIPGEERSSENSFSSTPLKRCESDEEKSCCTTAKESNTYEINSNSLKPSNSSAKSDITSVQSVPKTEHRKFEFDSLQSCSNSGSTIQGIVQEASGGKELSLAVCPSAPTEESLIVLIQHTQFERPLAEKLSTILKEAGIIVKMLSDIEHIIMMDAMTALTAIFEEVDFIVPVVSVNFLEQILPINSARYREAQDSMNNYTLYKLYENEFVINRFVNIRVKPVLLPDFNKNLVMKNLIFSKSLRLWAEVPKLIRVLRKTREIIQNFPRY